MRMKDLSAFIKQQQELKIKTIQNTNSILRMQIGVQILLGLILVAWILTTWLLFDMLLGQIVGTISSMIVLIMISMRVILIAFEIRDNNYKIKALTEEKDTDAAQFEINFDNKIRQVRFEVSEEFRDEMKKEFNPEIELKKPNISGNQNSILLLVSDNHFLIHNIYAFIKKVFV